MREENLSPEDLADRLVDFAVQIGDVANPVPDTRLGQHIADQVVRSGTAADRNYAEGRPACRTPPVRHH